MKESLFKNRYYVIIGLEILLLIVFATSLLFKPLQSYTFSREQLELEYGKIVEGQKVYNNYYRAFREGLVDTVSYVQGFAEENVQMNEDENYFISTPVINIESGIYKIDVEYSTEMNDIQMRVSSYNPNYNSVLMDKVVLSSERNHQSVEAWLNKNIRGFSVNILCDDYHSITIDHIMVQEALSGRLFAILKFLVVVIVINLFGYWLGLIRRENVNKDNAFVVTVLGMFVLFSSMPLLNQFLVSGDDIAFHLLRIEGIKDGLLSGQFPVRIHPTQLNGFGYANSIFYGEIFLYIPAMLRLLGVPLQTTYQLFLVLVNIATAILSYHCMYRITKDKKIALFSSLLYVFAPYRLTNMYVRAAVGEVCAMAFLPLMVEGVYQLLNGGTSDKEYRSNWLLMALGYTGILQSHLLSAVLVAFVVAATFAVCFKRIVRRETIIELIKFVIGVLLINAFFLAPFLYYMKKGGILVVDIGSQQSRVIQGNGIYPAQLLNLFVNGSGMAYGHAVEAYQEYGMYHEMGTTAGLALLVGLLIFVYCATVYNAKVKQEKNYRTEQLLTACGILLLWMSTNCFPWDVLCRNIGSVVYNIQFPWRLLSIASIILVVLAGLTAVTIKHIWGHEAVMRFGLLLIVLNVITAGYMMHDILDNNKAIYAYDATALKNTGGTGSLNEYLPSNAHLYDITFYEPFADKKDILFSYERNYLDFDIDIDSSRAKEDGRLVLPLLAYDGYVLQSTEKMEGISLTSTDNDLLAITVPKGFTGNVSVQYKGLGLWKFFDWISILSILAFCCFEMVKMKK